MTNRVFPEIKKNFGFGLMRLPMNGKEVDIEQTKKMVDAFIENGFNYFDTAHGYIDGLSELAAKECISKRYDRKDFLLVDKLTEPYFDKQEDIKPFFESQLEACGVDYFDFYLMHAQNAENFVKFKRCQAYETALELKKEGKIRHLGISFHDQAEVLDQILTEYPQVEIVQIQFNYLDYYDRGIDSKRVYEVARKHNKPLIIMEPVKGGNLVNLPDKAKEILDDLKSNYSYAGYAIRYAASFDGMEMVLSGMSNMEQMMDNIKTMKDFVPFNEEEFEAVKKVSDVFHSMDMIPCTACRYCIEESHCPMGILIPDMFASLNQVTGFNDWNQYRYYNTVLTVDHGKASECIKCGLCERVCPQHLEIRKLLTDVAAKFEG